jgi:hypothetical protein
VLGKARTAAGSKAAQEPASGTPNSTRHCHVASISVASSFSRKAIAAHLAGLPELLTSKAIRASSDVRFWG